MDAIVDVAESSVPFRLEIDFPGRFDEAVVRKIDLALDSLTDLDALARQRIAEAMRQAWSAPARLFEMWKLERNRNSVGVEGFLRQLRPSHITLSPDSGPGSLDRIVIAYRLTESPTNEKITVRFREGIGPELDPAPRKEFV